MANANKPGSGDSAETPKEASSNAASPKMSPTPTPKRKPSPAKQRAAAAAQTTQAKKPEPEKNAATGAKPAAASKKTASEDVSAEKAAPKDSLAEKPATPVQAETAKPTPDAKPMPTATGTVKTAGAASGVAAATNAEASKAADSAPAAKQVATPEATSAATSAAPKPAPRSDRSPFPPSSGRSAADTKAKATTPTAKPSQEQITAQRGRSIFWPLVLGGVAAAALGFVASEANLMGFRGAPIDMRGTIEEQAARLDEQSQQIAALQSAEPAAPGEAPTTDLSGIEGALAQLSDSIAQIQTRLDTLESRPATAAPTEGETEAAEAYAADLQEMRAALETQRSEIESLLQNAQSIEEATANAAREAAVQSGISQITSAIAGGAVYAEPVATLQDAGVTDLPQPLLDTADEGVVTLSNLQTRFPDVARDALTVARDAGLDGESDGFGGFLRRQLGARSVQPREGDTPDAVLSRAEAALRDGQLTETLSEIDSLPEDVQSAMGDWLADARARAAAQSAVNDLSQRLTAN